jgi:hypothetical protein
MRHGVTTDQKQLSLLPSTAWTAVERIAGVD